MNYFSFHIGDYAVHTRYLSLMEDLAYRRLLDLYYTLEGPIPSLDPPHEIGMSEYEAEVNAVLRKFFVEVDGAWHNLRCNEEIATYKRMGEGGRRGAAKRWGKGGDSPPTVTPMPTKNQEPRTKKEKHPPPPQGGAVGEFWRAWPTHPRKVAFNQCAAKWKKKGLDNIAPRIMAALEAAKRSEDWTKNNGEFIPAPLVWLNQDRWEAMAELAEHWSESTRGIREKAKELGMPEWDQIEQWVFYKARVVQRSKEAA